MQNYYNLMYREDEREMLPLCLSEGIAPRRGRRSRAASWHVHGPMNRRPSVPRPISSPRVVFAKTTAEMDKAVVDRTHDVARDRGLPAAQIAMAWLLAQVAVTSPIVGATKPHHLDDAIAAMSVTLSDEEVKRLEEVYQPRPATGAYS